MIQTIKCILKFHDDLSSKAILEPTDQARQEYYIKAVAIRDLLSKIHDDVVNKKDKDKFQTIINEHYEAMSKGMLWNRRVEMND